MSERDPSRNPERHEQHPELDREVDKHQKETLDKIIEKGHHARHEHAEKLMHIQHETREKALPKDKLAEHLKSEQRDEDQPMFINMELKDMAYRRTLTRTQKSLSAPSRTFSKVVHNRRVEAVSEVAAKTVARPSGILSGGIFACLGSFVFLWITKHYGYEYNFLLFIVLFIGGFALGLLIELALRLAQRKR